MAINCELDALVNLIEDKVIISINPAKNIFARRILREKEEE